MTWHQPDLYPSEPIFVKNPANQNEDDGIVMTNVFDSKRQISLLLLLDAKSFTEVARIDLPCHIPLRCMVIFIPIKIYLVKNTADSEYKNEGVNNSLI